MRHRNHPGFWAFALHRVSGLALVLFLPFHFLVLGLAEIRSVAWFGTLTSFAMIAAILTDLLLLPALATVAAGQPGSRNCLLAET